MKFPTSLKTIHIALCLLASGLFGSPLAAQSVDAEINVGASTTRLSAEGSLTPGELFYYRLNNPADVTRTAASLSDLTSDHDLYVQYGRLPTLTDYACRSWVINLEPEYCMIEFEPSVTVYIGVRAWNVGEYTLSIDGGPPQSGGTTIGQRGGRIDWNGWKLDYDTFTLADGLSLHDVSYDGTPLLSQASFPVMSVYYEDNLCGPYADRLNGPQAPVEWANNAQLVAREYTQDGVQWFELGIREFIGSYDIYQVWYLGADGTLDGHVFSRGLQCDYSHIHYPMWRFDFDIDGEGDDRILRETASGNFVRYTSEFDTNATDAFQHGWYVEDALSGYRVRIDFDDGARNVPGEVVPAAAYANNRIGGMLYRDSEKGWVGGARTNFLYNNAENIDGADVVLWYSGYLPHSPDEGSELWHSTGVRLRTDAQPVIDTDGDGIPDDIDPDDDNDGIPDEDDPNPLIPDDTASELISFETAIASGNDDVEQRGGGRVSFDSSDLELTFDANVNQVVGLRFNEVNIPQGVNIVRAYLQFQTDETNSEQTSLEIHGVASDNAGAWLSTRFNVSSRPRTNDSVSWSPVAWTQRGRSGSEQRTPNLAALVEEIVGRQGWRPGNALAFVIEGNGERVAEAYEGSRTGAARLLIEYESSNGNTPPDVDAGPDQSISIATSAALAGTVLDDGFPVPPGEVSLRWTKVSGPGEVNFGNRSSDTTDALFSAPGTYVLQLTADDGQFAVDDSLTVTVQSESGSTLIERQIVSRNDDVEEAINGAINVRSSDLELGIESSTAQTVGLRFTGVDIPAGATITAASIQFTVDEPNRAASSLRLYGEAIGNAASFTTSNSDVTSRARTAASVGWSPAPWPVVGASGNDQRTPDLSEIIQEIVNQEGWRENNALVVLIAGTGQRTAESFDGDNSRAPVLRVEFQ